MDIKKMTKEELEELSTVDIAYKLMEESKRTKKINALFEKIASLLKLTEKEKRNKIADFYTAISTDKRFIVLNNINVDLKTKHSINKIKVIEDTALEDAEDFIEEDNEETEERDEEDEYNSTSDDDEDETVEEAEDLKHLVIIDEEDLDA